ncbi:MAG: TrkH family potassium uptake protein [Clostridia bacterium]|nr:TrkH family potassium uptake protein [Clostridia bacterium]
MNRKIIARTLGLVMIFEAIFMILPCICGLIYKEKEATVFLGCSVILAVAGLITRLIPVKNKTLFAKDGLMIVSLSWILMSAAGAVPFVVSGTIPSYVDALFETVSGFTTTGASILSDVEALPKCMLFWRSFTHWIGGMGVLVFLVAMLPISGGSNVHLMRAESTGPAVSKLVPKVKSTAKILYAIYTGITIIQVVLLLLGDMSLFDALTTAFGTVGTGGFGVKNDSLAGYSPYIQNVTTIFMTLCGINFTLYYLLLIRHFKDVWRSTELRVYIGILAVSAILICINILPQYGSIGEAFRHSAFQVSSIMTTTGYSTTDFNQWPEFSKTILVIIMFVGACAGSTGGGMKVSRIIILLKGIVKELKLAAHPKSVHKTTMDGRMIEHETVRVVNAYAVAFAAIYVLSLLLISLNNQSFTTNFTAVAATINNIGPGLDAVGPISNYGIFSDFSKLVLTFDMLVGRLEIFPILILLSPYTWRK